MELLWDGGTKVCSDGPGHMTKMAAMPIYGKNLKKIFFSRTKRLMILNLGMHHWVLEYYQVCSNDNPELTLTYFTAGSNLVPYAFVWEKGKAMYFSETIVVYDLKLATGDQSDKKFLLTSKLCSLGTVCPLPWGYIHVLNPEKKYIKSDFIDISLKLATNGLSDKAFLLTSKFCSLGGCLPMPWGYIHVLNHEKKMDKIKLQRHFFETCNK